MQFGDFFNDMVVNITLAQTSAVGGVVPALPSVYIGPNDQVATSTQLTSGHTNWNGSATDANSYTLYVQDYADIQGNQLTPAAASPAYVRYAEYPGERLFKNVKFEVNGNPLDNYTAEAMLFYQKFRVQPNKIVGWKRLVGQEVPVDMYTDLVSISGASSWGAPITNLVDQSGAAVPAAPTTGSVTARQLVSMVYGPQTPQATQPALEMWIPLTLVTKLRSGGNSIRESIY